MTRRVMVGNVAIGGGAPVSIQSMANTDTADAAATIAQILRLQEAGCEIVRVSVYDEACAEAIPAMKKAIAIPLVADIHFDYRLAIASIERGVDKIRFNPGNIGSEANVRELVACARVHGTPIRIGVNAGSLEREVLEKYGGPTPEGMVESALKHVAILEKQGFEDIVLSLKASSVAATVAAYRLISAKVGYPLHVGVTEAGTWESALVKSSMGIGALLLGGIGDTIRVSITGDPVEEVRAAKLILSAAGLRKEGIEVISCPTCARTGYDLVSAVEKVKRALKPKEGKYLKVAVMGCVVNGPGEAKEADIGIAFGQSGAVLFRRGQKPLSLPLNAAVDRLILEAQRMLRDGE